MTRPKGVHFDTKRQLAYTYFHTCHWMICKNTPGEKARFSLSLSVPRGLRVIASGEPHQARTLPPVSSQKENRHIPTTFSYSSRGSSEVNSEENVVISLSSKTLSLLPPQQFESIGGFSGFLTLHISLVLRWAHSSTYKNKIAGITYHFYGIGFSKQQLKALFRGTPGIYAFFRKKAGVKLPFRHYRQVLVPGTAAQELSTLSIVGERFVLPLLRTPQEDWLLVHELAHQWWGNLVTCANWSHFWLNEGLVVFLVAAYKHHRWGKMAYLREIQLAKRRWNYARQRSFDVPLQYKGSFPSGRLKRAIVYSKGALFFHLLVTADGKATVLVSPMREYTRHYAGSAVTSQQLERVFQKHAPFSLRPLFRTWVYGTTHQKRSLRTSSQPVRK